MARCGKTYSSCDFISIESLWELRKEELKGAGQGGSVCRVWRLKYEEYPLHGKTSDVIVLPST